MKPWLKIIAAAIFIIGLAWAGSYTIAYLGKPAIPHGAR